MDTEKLKILLIEDNAGDARLIRELLAEAPDAPFRLEHVDTLSKGLARLAKGGVDVILLDLSLPDSQGLESLNKILAQTLVVPIVVLSGLSDESVAIKAVQEGAQDYLVKGSGDSNLLARSIHYAIERQRLRVALQESQASYRLLADNIADVIWTADSEARITYVSPSIKRFLGYTVEEAIKLKISDILTSDSLEQARRFIKWQISLYARGRQPPPASMTLEHIRKDGSTVWAEVLLSFLQGKDGRIMGIMGATRDITERRKAEEALRESEERLKRYWDSSPDAIYIYDLNGTFLRGNKAGEKLLGYSAQEIEGKSFLELDILPPEYLPKAVELLKLSAKGESTGPDEFEVIRKDGARVFVEITAYPIVRADKVEVIGIARDITERKRLEDALRASEEMYRLCFDNASDVIYLVNPEGMLLTISPSVEKMLGYTPDELLGHEFLKFNIFTPESLERALADMTRVLAGERVMSSEREFIAKDGTKRFVEINLAPVISLDGKVVSIMCATRDITERKRIEKALQQSELNYRTLFDSTIDGMAVIDAETLKVLLINQPILNKYGSGFHGDIFKGNVLDSVHPEDRERVLKLIVEDLFEKDTREMVKFRLINSESKVIWVSCVGARIMYQGRPAGLVSLRDITQQQEAEESLRQSEHNYKVLFESTLDGMVVIDGETMEIMFANQTAAKLGGFDSAQAIIGLKPLDFLTPDEKERAYKLIKEEVFEKDLHNIHEYRALSKDGEEVWVSVVSTRTEFQGRLAALVSLRDITEQKRAEEEKRRLEEQIQLAGRLAAVGELAAGVAHELNNPIAAIKGFAQLLAAKEDVDVGMKKDLQTILRESQRASKITQNMLTFARRHEPEKRFISINEALERTLELRAHQMKLNNIEMEEELDPNLPNTMADFYQMQQVFLNIINNAEQAMVEAHGKGKLIVRTRKVGGMVQINFIDDGPGISEENLKRIFDPFFTTKEVGRGTGLGLSICYGLVEAHCGRIYAKSKLGKGATFVVEIPIVTEAQAEAELFSINPS